VEANAEVEKEQMEEIKEKLQKWQEKMNQK
jgi:gas vesicle protein